MILPGNLGRAILWIFRPDVGQTTASSKVIKVQNAAAVDKFTVDIEGDVNCHDLTVTGTFTRTTDDFATGLTVATNAAAFATTGALRIGTAGASNFTVSAAGVVVVGSTLGVTGLTTLTGGLAIGSASQFAVAATTGILTASALVNLNGGIAVTTDKFTVASASGNTVIGGTLAVTGAQTMTGLLTANGGIATTTMAMTGILSGFLRSIVSAGSGTTSLTAAQAGAKCVNTGSSGTTTFQLPTAAAGLAFTFIEDGSGAGEIRILPAAGDLIVGKTDASDTGTAIATAVAAGIKNTAATNVRGDSVKLVAVDDTTWHMVSEIGVWAAI